MKLKLKKLADFVFQELKEADSDTRPPSWIRSFNALEIQLTNFTVQRNYNVASYIPYNHQTSPDSSDNTVADKQIFPEKFLQVRDDVRQTVAIIGEGVLLKRNAIYVADDGAFAKPEDDVYEIIEPRLPIELTLCGVTESSASESIFPNCKYSGVARWRSNGNNPEDRIYLNFDLPIEYITEIIQTLESDNSLDIFAVINLLSFKNEMDNASWRQHDYVISSNAAAILHHIILRKRDVEDVSPEDIPVPTALPPAYVPLMETMIQRMSKFTMAMYIIAVLLALHLLK